MNQDASDSVSVAEDPIKHVVVLMLENPIRRRNHALPIG
jgi:hypothetical protein